MKRATAIRRLVALLTAALAVTAVGCRESSDPNSVSPPPASATPPAAPSADEVLTATTGAGDAKLRVDVQAHMPSDFDDGIPERAFGGTGFLDQDKALAGINYEMSSVPNSAGYFGQVDGEMNVFYSGSEWIVSFPLMASALAGRLDWLSYDLETMADPRAQELGIGQLREIGLADPRLGLALLGGAGSLERGAPTSIPPAATPASPAPTPTGTPHRASADVAGAAQAATTELRPLLEGLQELGVTTVELGVTLDSERRVETLSYTLSYAPKKGSEPVEMRVTHTYLKYGLEGGLNAPTGRSVKSFAEYVQI